jgi:hypothetical protein
MVLLALASTVAIAALYLAGNGAAGPRPELGRELQGLRLAGFGITGAAGLMLVAVPTQARGTVLVGMVLVVALLLL